MVWFQIITVCVNSLLNQDVIKSIRKLEIVAVCDSQDETVVDFECYHESDSSSPGGREINMMNEESESTGDARSRSL
jgi:hypothetical protein